MPSSAAASRAVNESGKGIGMRGNLEVNQRNQYMLIIIIKID
jgi:hypothetical protein